MHNAIWLGEGTTFCAYVSLVVLTQTARFARSFLVRQQQS
jgi:hypothetical protein